MTTLDRERRPAQPTAMTDPVTARYMRECEDGALRGAFEHVVLPPTYDSAYGELRLPRPLFVDHDEIAAFGADLVALYDLIGSLPERCFGGDVGRYCAALGLDPRQAELMRMGATGGLELYGRADAYHDGRAFRLLEFNVGSELGGIDAAQMNRAFLAVPAFADFAERQELEFVDTAAILAAQLRRAAERVTASGEPAVALVDGPGGLRDHGHVFTAIAEALVPYGIELQIGEAQDVRTAAGGRLTLGGAALDVVLRYFTASELLEHPGATAALAAMVRADAGDRTVLFTPLEHSLMESKANLALLHDPRNRAAFTRQERELVDRVVPWTRTIGAGVARSERAALREHCRARRASLILKPGTGCGGVGAVLGRELGDGEWSAVLDAIGDQDYVAQEVVVPAGEPVLDPATGELCSWQANWGIFATGEGYAGAFVRALRARDGAVISYGNAETRGTCVFTHGARGAGGEARR